MKQFLVILGLTALVWLGVSLGVKSEYTLPVRIEYSGHDTVRYAIVHADTICTLRVESTGYEALLRSIFDERPVVHINLGEGRRAIGADEVCSLARQQLRGIRNAEAEVDSLRIVLVPRACRTYRPLLDKVTFNFAEQYGLYGQPTLEPAEVTLYGPEEDLDRIDEVHLAPVTIDGIDASATYRLALQPIWTEYTDVHPSCTEVRVHVPVEAYIERQYTVPITVTGADTSVLLRLYPEQVTLSVWVAQRDMDRTPEFEVTIPYADILTHGDRLSPQLTQFPDYLRPRSLQPAEVQCVVIR